MKPQGRQDNKFYCENCGKPVPAGAAACPSCGASFDKVRCPKCGYIGEEIAFSGGCPSCGYLAQEMEAGGAFPDATKSPLPPSNKKSSGGLGDLFYLVVGGVLIVVLIGLIVTLFSM